MASGDRKRAGDDGERWRPEGPGGWVGAQPRMDYRGVGPRGYVRSDRRIEEDIHDRLTDDPAVDATEIEVTVKNGEVTLDGTVENRFERRRAEDIVDQVSGVSYIQNRLRTRERRGPPYHASESAINASGGYGTSARSATGTSGGASGGTGPEPGPRTTAPSVDTTIVQGTSTGRVTEPRGASSTSAQEHAMREHPRS